MDCVTEDRRVFGITGDHSTAALDPEDYCVVDGMLCLSVQM